MIGTPPVRALFFEFPEEPELFDVSAQFLVGRDILVTPVLIPNVTTVNGTSGVPQVRRILIRSTPVYRHIPWTWKRNLARLVYS
jgi:hypothetical protein